ncbi:hypothetical protein H2248_009007 [Termitomyces sp. 'cryptogamus']|nr:hypothetical protein H2248_009007 [Termitomyces sp. 'cryptogamus']
MADEPDSDTQNITTPLSTVRTPQSHSDDEVTRASTPARNSETKHGHQHAKNIDIQNEEKGIKESSASHQSPSFPDGGWRAWLVVVGAMCNTFSTFGFVNAWGTFQAHYQQSILKDSSPSDIAWIGSIQYSLIFLPGILVGRLFDLGYLKSILSTSSVLLIVATFLVAQCTRYWHFVLCQGIVIGIAAGGIFGPTTAVIGHWFHRRRGLAMGWIAVGSSLGGTLLPIAANNLIATVGFQWTMRIIGFILIVTLGVANLTLKRRLPPVNVAGGLLNLQAFKYAPFTAYCLSAFFSFLGIYTVLTYVSVSALELGISESLSFYLLSIANASSLFGRLSSGLLADRCGPGNIIIPFTAVAGILTYAWPFARTQRELIAVVVLYGFSSGAYVSLMATPIMSLGVTDDIGRRIGMFMSILSLGALAGPPISGAINTASGGFEVVGYYAGSMVLVGVALMLLTRHLVLGRVLGKF